MRNCLKTIISISAVVSVLGLNSSAFGVPAFARQTGLDCTSCHSSAGFPTLNTFGAAFKAGGYVNGDDANMMGDGEALSIPKALNMSVVAKVRANYFLVDPATGSSTGTGRLDIPDEYALMLGGRVAKNIGFITEWGADGAAMIRLPIVFDVGPAKVGAVVWGTDATGPQTVFEVAATGAQRNLRVFENLKGPGQEMTGALASGIGAYVYHSMFYAAVTGFTNQIGEVTDKPAYYARAAVTPNVGGLDTLVGVQYYTGKTGEFTTAKVTGTPVEYVSGVAVKEHDHFVIDAQVMGNLGVPMVIFGSFGKQGTKEGKASMIQAGVDAQVVENKANVGLGFTRVDSGVSGIDPVQHVLVAGKYNLARNVRLNLEYNKGLTKGSEDSQIQAMLFGSW